MSPQIIFDGGSPSGPGNPIFQITPYTCSQILALVSQQLQDITNKTWPVATSLIPYLNLAIKEIVNARPEAYTVLINQPLASGPRQYLPAGALSLVDVESSLDINNNPTGSVVMLSKEQMDRFLPGWYSWANATDERVEYCIKDDRNPLTFYVFPPPPATTGQSVALICSVHPDDIADLGTTEDPVLFPLDTSYVPSAVDITTGFALREETTVPGALAKSASLMQSGYQKLSTTKQSAAETGSKGA